MQNIQSIIDANVNGATFISIDTETTPTLTGGNSNPMKDRVRKITSGSSVMVFQNKTKNGYEQMVMRRLSKEGKNPASFKLAPRAWGVRMEGTPFVEHKGEKYLEVIFLKAGETSYTLDGAPIAKEEIIGLKEGAPAHQGGLDDKVIIRTFKVDSVKSLTINHQRYVGPFK